MSMPFQGYERNNGEVGIRNYVLLLSMVHCANTVTQQISWKTGAQAITHDFGCIEFEDKHARTRLSLLSAALNPNVFAVVLVGLGCEQTDHESLRKEIAEAGKPVSYVGNATIGAMTDLVTAEGGSVIISEVSGFPGSEHILAERAVTPEVGLEVIKMCDELREEYVLLHGQKIEEVNPSPGNKAGGITTMVEKSMGNVKKMGVTSKLQGLIYAGQHVPSAGLWMLDLRAPAIDANATSGFAMSGAHIDVFSTGRGTPMGNAVMPVLKLTGNPKSFAEMGSMLDFNAGVVMEGTPIAEAGKALLEKVIEIANGEKTKSEINGDFEFIIPRENNR